jgi:hypothetical protein
MNTIFFGKNLTQNANHKGMKSGPAIALKVGFLARICYYITFIFITLYSTVTAQEAGDIIYGGNFGLQFGNTTVIDISPNIAYQFNHFVLTGSGVTYQYYNTTVSGISESDHIFGWRVFTEVSLIQNIVAHLEYETLNMKIPAYEGGYNREWINCFLVGGGYRQMITDHSFASINILWDVIGNPHSPYQNPIYRFGFGFGF